MYVVGLDVIVRIAYMPRQPAGAKLWGIVALLM
jgi:hypothetical protein